MTKSSCLLAVLFGLILVLFAPVFVLADSLKFISTEPGPGSVLVTGQCLKLTFRYELTSADAADIGVEVWYGRLGDSKSSTSCRVKRGEGEASISVTMPNPAVLESLNLWMLTGTPNGMVFLDCPAKVKWVDNRFSQAHPNPASDSVWKLGIPWQFPHAQDLYDKMVSNGLPCVYLYTNGTASSSWTIEVGLNVEREIAQDILEACLKCTTNIARVRMGADTSDPFGRMFCGWDHNGTVRISASTELDFPPMPADLIAKLASANINEKQFREMVSEWNMAAARRKDEELHEKLMQRGGGSSTVKDVFDAFSVGAEATLPEGTPTNGLIAYYRFNKDARDSSILDGKAEPSNPKFDDGSLYLDWGKGGSMRVRLPALRYEQFTVSLDVKPLELGARQESGRYKGINIVVGGWDWKWFALDVAESGDLQVGFNLWRFMHVFPGAEVLIDDWNSIACSVDVSNKVVLVCLNGRRLPNLSLPENFVPEILGTEVHEKEKQLRFVFCGSESEVNGKIVDCAFRGYIRNLAVYDRALSFEEMEKLEAAVAKTRPATPHTPKAGAQAKAISRIPPDAGQDALNKMEKAADGGDSEAQFQMGELCFRGTNVLIPIDNVEAFYWYLKAAAQNHAKAKQMLETIKTESLIPERDIDKARKKLQAESAAANKSPADKK
jgi:hypothetical protein